MDPRIFKKPELRKIEIKEDTANIKQNLKYYEDMALSDNDIRKKLGASTNIIVYPDIYKYKSLDQLLGPQNSAVILYEWKPKYGHWVTIFKTGKDTVEFFNSYGGKPDEILKKVDKDFRMQSHEDYPYLTQLIMDSPYHLVYNHTPLQKKSPDVLTCGRHVIFRLMNKNLSLDDYIKKLDYLAKKYNTDYDGVVTLMTV